MNFLKSRSIQFALALAVMGVLESQLGLLAPYMTKEFFGLFSIGVSIAVAVLRVITTVPLSEK